MHWFAETEPHLMDPSTAAVLLVPLSRRDGSSLVAKAWGMDFGCGARRLAGGGLVSHSWFGRRLGVCPMRFTLPDLSLRRGDH